MMQLRIGGFTLLWITFLAVDGSASGDESITTDIGLADLSLRQFVADTVESNPRIRAARMTLLSKSAMRDAESQPQYNPEFMLNVENSESRTRSVGIGQTIDWNGTRIVREQVADSDRLFAEAEFLALKRAFMAELLEGLASYQIGLMRIELVQRRQQLMNDLVVLAVGRFESGDISQLELDLVKLAATTVHTKGATIRANHVHARQTVKELAPQTNTSEWPLLPDDIPKLPESLYSESLVKQLPEVLMAELTVQKNDSLINLRRSERLPDPTLNLVGGKEDQELTLGLSVSIPLFIRNPFKHEVTATRAERSASQLRAEDILNRAHVRLDGATERFGILRSVWVDWQSTSEESLSRPLNQLKPLWETGELSTADYVVQLTSTLEARESKLDLVVLTWLAWFDWLMSSGQIDVWLGVDS